MNKQKDFFSSVIPIVNDYILLACRHNWGSNPSKPFAGGNPGGVRYADPSKNGEDELRYNHSSKDSVKNVMRYLMRRSAPLSESISYFPDLSKYITDTQVDRIYYQKSFVAEKVNATKEALEETGVVILEIDPDFVHEQRNRYGTQTFFLGTKIMKFNGNEKNFQLITDLPKELPRPDLDYQCLDPDITHTVAVHIDKVFSHPDIEIIPTHVAAIAGAITHYKYIRSLKAVS